MEVLLLYFEYIIPFSPGFRWESCQYSHVVALVYENLFSLIAFKILSLIDHFIPMCCTNLFELKRFGDIWALWTWLSKYLPQLMKFSFIISLNTFSAPFSPLFSWNFNNTWLCLLMVSHSSYRLFSHSVGYLFILLTLSWLKEALFLIWCSFALVLLSLFFVPNPEKLLTRLMSRSLLSEIFFFLGVLQFQVLNIRLST